MSPVSERATKANSPASPGPARLTVLAFGSYDRGVGRNAVLAEGLQAAGVRVLECWTPLWRDTAHKLAAVRGTAVAGRTAARLAGAWWRLARAHHRCSDYQVMLVGATAHLDMPLARWLCRRRQALLLFDPVVSIVETALDRGLLTYDSARLRALGALERRLFRLADVRLADTAVHRDAMACQTGTADRLWWVVPAGAPSTFRRLTPPLPDASPGRLRVLYFGQYIPLHGVETILQAASLLRDQADIEFELVGVGQTLDAARDLASQLGLERVRFRPQWLTIESLCREHVAAADICLGVFGRQTKAGRVVPQKVYAGLACGRAVVTADTPAIRELLQPGQELWVVPPAAPEALAAALRLLADQDQLRRSVARQGQQAYDRRFAPLVLGSALRDELERLLGPQAARSSGAGHPWPDSAASHHCP